MNLSETSSAPAPGPPESTPCPRARRGTPRPAPWAAALLFGALALPALAAPLTAQTPRRPVPPDSAQERPARPDSAAARPDSAAVRAEGAGADGTAAADSSVFLVQPLVVRAARAVTTAGGASAVELRLDSMALPPAPTLEQVARLLPSVQVRRNSRGEAQISVRGSEERQVAVLVDGVPLSLGWDHRADLSVVPMTAAHSVRLVRGLPSVLHGPNVLGGVVEVGVARDPGRSGEPPPFQASAGVDHVGGTSAGAVAARTLETGPGELLVRAGAGWRDRPGVPLPDGLEAPAAGDGDDAGGPGPGAGSAFEGPDGLLVNSDFRQADGFLALRYRGWDGGWLSLSASGYAAERGVVPELHVAEPRRWRYPDARRLLAAVSAGTGQRDTPAGTGDLEASLGVDIARTEILRYADGDYREVEDREAGDDRTITLRLLGDHTLGERGELRGAMTLAEVSRDERIASEGAASYRQRLWSLGSEVAWRVPDVGPLAGARLSVGGALDGADTPETGGKPALGRLRGWGARAGVTALAAGGKLLLHAGGSRRERFPSLRELYSGALGRFEPNPGLRPERLTALEAGATARSGAGELQAVLFHHRLDDAIVRAAADHGRYRRENRDQLRSTGLELLASWSRGGFSLGGDLTLQDVKLLDPAGERRPEYRPAVAGRADVAVPLPYGLRAGADLTHVGRQWCVHPDLGREVPIEASTTADLELGRAWSRGAGAAGAGPFSRIETTLALDNAGDAAVYDQCGLPRPGRTLRLQVRIW